MIRLAQLAAELRPFTLDEHIIGVILLLYWIKKLRRRELFGAPYAAMTLDTRNPILLTNSNFDVAMQKRDVGYSGYDFLISDARLQQEWVPIERSN